MATAPLSWLVAAVFVEQAHGTSKARAQATPRTDNIDERVFTVGLQFNARLLETVERFRHHDSAARS
jgi:hypothetical protein